MFKRINKRILLGTLILFLMEGGLLHILNIDPHPIFITFSISFIWWVLIIWLTRSTEEKIDDVASPSTEILRTVNELKTTESQAINDQYSIIDEE